MYEAVCSRYEEQHIVIKAAAVGGYRPPDDPYQSGDKMVLELERTDDILQFLGEHKKQGQFLCGFSMETENMLENSRGKLHKKNLDMIIANNLKEDGAGFGTDTNVITIITEKKEIPLSIMSKEDAANCILDEIMVEIKGNQKGYC